MARSKTGLDISEFAKDLGNVSISDTDMRWIDTAAILDNSLNFYPRPNNAQLAELMESIEANGLLEPPTVVPTEESGLYRLISGHSRMTAVRLLQTTPGGERWDKVLCRVLPPMDNDRELTAVIEANRQRTKTPALLAQEAEKLTASYVARKKAGEDLPGRIRDRVAADMQLSATKLANLKTIKEGIRVPGFQKKWSRDEITESAALLIAQMDVDRQYRLLDWIIDHDKPLTVPEIRKFDTIWTGLKHKCPETAGLCPNAERIYDAYFHHGEWSCPGCCQSCLKKDTCQVACDHCGKKAPEAKPVETVKNPVLDDPRLVSDRMVQVFCKRLADLRTATGLNRKEFAESLNYFQATYSAWENNSLPGTTNVPRLALALGVTTDYLFGLSDEPKPAMQAEGQLVISGWMPGGTTPAEPGRFAVLIDFETDEMMPKILLWNGAHWTFPSGVYTAMQPSWWMRLPDDPEKEDDHD